MDDHRDHHADRLLRPHHGAGHQEAKLFVNNKKEYEGSSEFNWSERPINTILMKMGISKKEGLDEFDTVGLSNFRSNEDFN